MSALKIWDSLLQRFPGSRLLLNDNVICEEVNITDLSFIKGENTGFSVLSVFKVELKIQQLYDFYIWNLQLIWKQPYHSTEELGISDSSVISVLYFGSPIGFLSSHV